MARLVAPAENNLLSLHYRVVSPSHKCKSVNVSWLEHTFEQQHSYLGQIQVVAKA